MQVTTYRSIVYSVHVDLLGVHVETGQQKESEKLSTRNLVELAVMEFHDLKVIVFVPDEIMEFWDRRWTQALVAQEFNLAVIAHLEDLDESEQPRCKICKTTRPHSEYLYNYDNDYVCTECYDLLVLGFTNGQTDELHCDMCNKPITTNVFDNLCPSCYELWNK